MKINITPSKFVINKNGNEYIRQCNIHNSQPFNVNSFLFNAKKSNCNIKSPNRCRSNCSISSNEKLAYKNRQVFVHLCNVFFKKLIRMH